MNNDDYQKHIRKIGQLRSEDEIISSSALSDTNKVFYDDTVDSSFSKTMDLSVRYVLQDEYHKLVTGDPEFIGKFEPKTLYVVSSDYLNAYNTNIKNVGDPITSTDGANKRYVDQTAESLINMFENSEISLEDSVNANSTKGVKSRGIYTALQTLSTDLTSALSIDVENTVMRYSPNAVKSSGIYTALSTLSGELNTQLSLKLDAGVFKEGQNAVSGGGIYEFVETLSNQIKQAAIEGFVGADLLDTVVENESHGVKSSGIYTALKNISVNLDNTLNVNSENPVQNKTITSRFNGITNELNDIRNTYIKKSGGENIGPIHISADLSVAMHGLIGKDVDFSIGGPENFAVGHDHKFYGKESFAVHDHNFIGSKGIYWKAIDTTNKRIYLTKNIYYNKQNAGHNNDQSYKVKDVNGYFGNHKSNNGKSLDIPYFGPREDAATTSEMNELFTSEDGINLVVPKGTSITIKNYTHFYPFLRCFKVNKIRNGSVIEYTEDGVEHPLDDYYKHTIYRPDSKKGNDSHYIVYFPDNVDITCDKSALVPATSFGCGAIGDHNYVGAVNTFATGYDNQVTGQRSAALGESNRLSGEHQYAIGTSIVLAPMSKSAGIGFNLQTKNDNEIAIGKYNKSTKSNDSSQATAFSIGTGKSDNRKNAFEIKQNDDIYINGELELGGNLNIGDRITNVGDNSIAIGNDLTVGSYNFFWKGIDYNTSNNHGYVYLTNEQPRYPYPFVIQNSDKTQFKILGYTIKIDDTSTYNGLSAGSSEVQRIWNCSYSTSNAITDSNHSWRDDYNQLCIDLDGTNYRSNLNGIKEKLNQYILNAFTASEDPKTYILGHESELIGKYITMVNADKNNYRRCGKITDIINGSVLEVDFGITRTDGYSAATDLKSKGARFGDFDYDDACLVFIDNPLLKGPTNVSQYSSLNVGALNTVLRRCSAAIGKQNRSEMDFAMAIGRKAHAMHYASFIWAPAVSISTDVPYTFNIGLNSTLPKAHLKTFTQDIMIVGNDNKKERLYKYVWACLSNDASIASEFNSYIGSGNFATKEYVDDNFVHNDTTFVTEDVSKQMSSYAYDQSKTYTNTVSNDLSSQIISYVDGLYVTTTDAEEISGYTFEQSKQYANSISTDLSDIIISDISETITNSINELSDELYINESEKYLLSSLAKNQMTKIIFDDNDISTFNIVGEFTDEVFFNSGIYDSLNNKWNKDVRELIIGSRVTEFNVEIYEDNTITAVTIPKTLSSICDTAFKRCIDLQMLKFQDRTRQEVEELENYPWGINFTTNKLNSISVENEITYEKTQECLNALSTTLSSDYRLKIESLSTSLSNDIIDLSIALSGEIGLLSTSLSTDIQTLSTSLSGETSLLSTSLSTDIQTLSVNLSTDVNTIKVNVKNQLANLSAFNNIQESDEFSDCRNLLSGIVVILSSIYDIL